MAPAQMKSLSPFSGLLLGPIDWKPISCRSTTKPPFFVLLLLSGLSRSATFIAVAWHLVFLIRFSLFFFLFSSSFRCRIRFPSPPSAEIHELFDLHFSFARCDPGRVVFAVAVVVASGIMHESSGSDVVLLICSSFPSSFDDFLTKKVHCVPISPLPCSCSFSFSFSFLSFTSLFLSFSLSAPL